MKSEPKMANFCSVTTKSKFKVGKAANASMEDEESEERMKHSKWLFYAVSLGFALLVCSQEVEAQACRVIHSENLGVPSTIPLMPSDVAAQGGSTATLNFSVINGSQSHRGTFTPGTPVWWSWGTNNCSRALGAYYFINGDGIHHPWGLANTLNGNSNGTTSFTQADVGNTYQIFFPAQGNNGGTVQDTVTVTIVSGPAGTIIENDDFPTNYYEELQNNFNGTTSMNFEYCPGAATATHTAPFFGSITNPTTGETQSFNTSIAFRPNGGYNEEVPPTYVSFLPGDKPPQTSTTGRVMCTIAGDFVGLIAATGDSTKNQRVDKKMWTKVKISTTVQASDGGWYTERWCEEKELPIWDPNELYTSLAPLNQFYWTAQTCSSSPPGTDPGPGWHCPAISGGPGPGNPQQFFPSLSSVKGSCNTNVNTPAPY